MSINNIVISGRAARVDDAKIGQANGQMYVTFAIACNRPTKDKKADFFNCIAFDKTAELISDLIKKGDQLTIHGRLQNDEWEKDGQKRVSAKIIVNGFDKMWPPKQDTANDQPPSNELPEGNFNFNG